MQQGTIVARGTRVICSGCGTRYAIGAEHYGRSFRCDQCQDEVLVPEYQQVVDARPVLRRGQGVIWSKIETERERIYDSLRLACEKHAIEAHVLRSSPYEPAMVTFECWLPRSSPLVTERSSAVITINPMPFHRYDVLYDVVVRRSMGLGELSRPVRFPFRPWFFLVAIFCFQPLLVLPLLYLGFRFLVSGGGKTKAFTALRELPAQDLEALVGFLQHKGWCPYLGKYSVRRYWWQFWRPKNKVDALMPDWLAILDLGLVVGGFPMLGLAMYSGEKHPWLLPVGPMLWVGAVGLWIYLKLRPRLVRSSGKPDNEPRDLLPAEGWHIVLFDVGPSAAGLKAEFEDSLNTAQKRMKFYTEKVWYRGLDDIEEREQMVLQFGRAMVYCQIYQYQDDLYVGWDAFLNQAQWEETSVRKGLDRECGLPVTIAVAVPGHEATTEYDEADLNLAAAWVHARLSKLVQRLIKDQRIDQEIDFRPTRQERTVGGARLGGSLKAPGGARSLPGRFMALFRRKA
jgi:hypothetical protein